MFASSIFAIGGWKSLFADQKVCDELSPAPAFRKNLSLCECIYGIQLADHNVCDGTSNFTDFTVLLLREHFSYTVYSLA